MKSTNLFTTAFAAGLIAAIWMAFLMCPIMFFIWAIPTPFVVVPLSFVWVVFWIVFTGVVLKES